jgi:hypothetical protein
MNSGAFAGHDDRRLPKISELQTLVDLFDDTPPINVAFHEVNCGPSCPDVTDPTCSRTRSAFHYRSATTWAVNNAAEWEVDKKP